MGRLLSFGWLLPAVVCWSLLDIAFVEGAYQESACTSLGGVCQADSITCRGGRGYLSGKCPTQPANIRCCVPSVYQESRCTNSGGSCQVISASCSGGGAYYTSGLCPTQPSYVKCCVRPSGGGSGGCPRIFSRAEWGARSPKSRTTISNYRPYWFIHHSVSGECSSQSSCASKVRGIQNYHMDSRRYSDVGYSFLVGGDGSVFEGRGWNVQGAHTAGYNSRGYAICFIGDFMNKSPTAAALAAAQRLIACGVSKGKVSSGYRLYGHRQAGSTSCPGNTLYRIIQSWPRWASGSPN